MHNNVLDVLFSVYSIHVIGAKESAKSLRDVSKATHLHALHVKVTYYKVPQTTKPLPSNVLNMSQKSVTVSNFTRGTEFEASSFATDWNNLFQDLARKTAFTLQLAASN